MKRRIEITASGDTALIEDAPGLQVEMDEVVESHDVTEVVTDQEWKDAKRNAALVTVSLDKDGKVSKLETKKQAKPETLSSDEPHDKKTK